MARAARTDVLPLCGLFVGFLLLYSTVGVAFHRNAPMAFAYLDQLFDADVPSRVIDLTRFAGPHHRTQYHPLLLLFLNPVGVALRAALRAVGTEQAGRLAAILLCASAGALGVAAFFRLLRKSALDAGTAAAWSVVFGLSASQLFFSVFPESWVFSTLALLLLFGAAGRAPARVAAGVFAFGMAVTNVVAVALARPQPDDGTASGRGVLRERALYVLAVLAVAAALSLVQTAVYPGTASFWSVSGLARDDRLSFVWPGHPRDVVARVSELVPHFFGWSLAPPRTVILSDGSRTVVDFPRAGGARPRPLGLVHALVWGSLLVAAVLGARRTRSWRRPIVASLLLWTLALGALHLVFGTSLFLYSGQWTFAVVALVALSLDPAEGLPRKALLAALLALAVLQVATNSGLLLEIARAFPPPGSVSAPAY
jgi:hypothetical protein